MEYITLRNNNKLPVIGLGTWQINDRGQMADVISDAIDVGYRLFDTASAYSNEIALGKAIQAKGIAREEIVLTDKVWHTNMGYEEVQNACKISLKKLKTSYLDCYLIHWPASERIHSDWEEINAETWRGMEKLMREGLVRNIGVCNFDVRHLKSLLKTAEISPLIDQVEFHPGILQTELRGFCREKAIAVQASSPLGNGQILQNETITLIAEKKRVSCAQVCLRWTIQKNVMAIPKTVDRNRLHENIDVFGFALSDEEMDMIDHIPYCGSIVTVPSGVG